MAFCTSRISSSAGVVSGALSLSFSCALRMAVCRGLGNKTQEILLLRFSECDPPFRLWSAAVRLELAVNALAGIFADVIVVHGHFKRRVKETVPVYYESQGRHYMAVTDLDRCFFCCLYGNNEEEVIIREVKRDFEYEAEMVFLEQYFWENHVQRHVPPPYTESGALIIESARKHFGPADKNAPAVALDLDMTAKLMQYLRLLDEKKNAEVYSKEIDKDIQRLKALLIAEMGTSCTAVCEQEGVNYTVTYTPVRKSIIDKDNLLRLKLEHPDIYEQFVTVSESRRFSVRASIMEAA